MTYCRECGKKHEEEWNVCPYCGENNISELNANTKGRAASNVDELMIRVENMGEATGPKPTEKLVKPSEPNLNPRQKSLSQLLAKPPFEFNYVNDVFGTVYYDLINDNDEYITYLVKVRKDGELQPRWTTLVWVFKRPCEHHTYLIDHHNLSTPERVIHTLPDFTCKYMRRRRVLDYILIGFEKHYGLAPYSAL